MLLTKDFIEKFSSYSDKELLEIENNLSGYSEQAQEALKIVLNQRGGREVVASTVDEDEHLEREIERVKNETYKLSSKETDIEFIKKAITSDRLSNTQINDTIDSAYGFAKKEWEDEEIDSKIVTSSIIGCALASILGGILWGAQMIFSHRIFYILGVGLFLMCVSIVKLITKKSFKNKAVLIGSVIAVILSMLIGQLLFSVIGFIE